MRGTEKQIAWAADIIGKVVPILEQASAEINAMPGNETVKAANIARLQKRIDELRNAEYAGDVIEIFNGIRFSGNQQQDFLKVLSAYRVTIPNTAGMKKILCK